MTSQKEKLYQDSRCVMSHAVYLEEVNQEDGLSCYYKIRIIIQCIFHVTYIAGLSEVL